MDVLIRTLAQARQAEAEHKAELQQINTEAAALVQEQFGDQLDSINAKLSEAQDLTRRAESAIRDTAICLYRMDGDKRPHAAVAVKIYITLSYYRSDAFDYCVKHLPGALKMDKRRFETVAKAAELEFVDVIEEPRSTIARDLSAYL